MKQSTSKKQFLRWFSLLAYIALLIWMGVEKLHRSHPAIFFAALAVMTVALMIVFRLLYRGERDV